MLGWSADQFWDETPHDTFQALEAWRRTNCAPSDADKRRDFVKWRKGIEQGLMNGEAKDPHVPEELQRWMDAYESE